MTALEPLMRRNFLEYASYVVVDRAIPDLRDGCKPVQRRLLHTLWEMDDGKFIKVANVIGETMKLHPHGDASIGEALVVLANKGRCPSDPDLGYFIERQGNFGNLLTGDAAAAPRYIECRLTELARETLFNPALTRMVPSYDGRKEEPEALPAKLPVALLLGTEGIAVGMATSILPHNLAELLKAQIAVLRGERFRLYPDFPQGGIMDASEYDDGRGRVRVRARIEAEGDKRVVIREIPPTTTVDTLIASIEEAAEKGKVKISEIVDRTAAEVEIVLSLPRGVHADEVIPQLYAYTLCEVSVASNIVVIRDDKPAEMTASEVLRACTERLVALTRAELEHQRRELEARRHALTLERIFIERRVYKRIEEEKTAEAVRAAVRSGLEPYRREFVRELTEDDIARLLEIPIKRISAYDIAQNRRQLAEVEDGIRAIDGKLADLTGTCIAWLERMLDKYGKLFPRRTKIKGFEAIDKKAVANANLRVGYDPESGFLGTAVKGGERELKVSEYDKLIAITQDGVYRIMSPPEKTLIEGKLVHLDRFDDEQGLTLTLIYRDEERRPWGKVTTISSYIKDKEYELIKGRAGRIEWLGVGRGGIATLHFAPAKGQRIHELVVDLATLEPCGVAARGSKLADKPVQRVVVSRPAPEAPSDG
ncbi:MAG: DNA topoisomerase IV subunit A [Planctomycetota bacterium]|nr:DNA topoisomerase IV subunit A [Planctomycetota bacterium]MDW8373388.1 DNA topoisomerase IV subunit A [Planctomycetota bacterium]